MSWEWIVVIAVVVLIFGVGKLGNIGGALGKSIREFRQEKDKDKDKIENSPQLSTKKEDTQPEANSKDESKD
jgi:sec-independent protein translocase protein TatA